MRGEGALIVNRDGHRFVLDADPRGELAGRDVVARAIWDELGRSGERCVYLDCSPLGARAAVRFPTIAATCAKYGLDIARDPIPCRPGGALHDRRGTDRSRRRHHDPGAVRLR